MKEILIRLEDELYEQCKNTKLTEENAGFDFHIIKSVANGTPLEEIQNPCIECSQNCCVCELNGEKCECQKVYVVKESKE